MNTLATTAPAWTAVQALDKFKQTGAQQAQACCPAHHDRDPSLSIGIGDDGRILLDCKAGCSSEGVVEAMGCTWADLWPPKPAENRQHSQNGQGTPKRIVKTYDYCDESGKLLYQTVRYEPKDFRQRRPNGHGGWLWKDALQGVRRVPYRLADVVASPPAVWVFLVEGEKDADRLARLGLTATTTVGGAKSIGQSAGALIAALRGRHVVILPDADDAGDKYAADAQKHLHGAVASLRIVRLPELAHTADHGQDVSDWLDAGATVEQLEALITDTPPEPTQSREKEDDPDDTPTAEQSATEEIAAFPVEVFPEPLRRLVEEGARALNCPSDFLGVPLLVLAGVAIGNSRCLQIKAGWREHARIWAAVVAAPGTKKSPALDLVSQPFRKRQRELEADYQQALKAYQEEKKNDPNSQLSEPTMGQIITTDATLEALADLLDANPRGVVFSRDELAGWARSMNQYKNGKGADRQNWLSLWNGAQVVINRRGRKRPVLLDAPFVGVVGALPPDVLGELSDERGRDDGFIHRILFAFPERLTQHWTEDEVAPDTQAAVYRLFQQLWTLESDHTSDERTIPVVLPFTPLGKRLWREWITNHYAEQEEPTFPDGLRGPWAKMEGYTARLALILHLCRWVCGEATSESVDERSMAGAAELIDYFKSHARRIYTQLHTTPEDKRVMAAVAWIGKQKGLMATARQLLTVHVGGVKTAEEAKALLWELQERGFGVTEEIASTHGRPQVRCTLHAQYAARCNKASAQTGSAA